MVTILPREEGTCAHRQAHVGRSPVVPGGPWHSHPRMCGVLCTVRRRGLQQNTLGPSSDPMWPFLCCSLCTSSVLN